MHIQGKEVPTEVGLCRLRVKLPRLRFPRRFPRYAPGSRLGSSQPGSRGIGGLPATRLPRNRPHRGWCNQVASGAPGLWI